MAARLFSDPEADGWERSDFPIVCETCLGPNPYVRMQRMEYGGECHISGRPYTKFRWRPGSDARYKSTIICQEVAKAKNVCQVCLLDLDYNLPVQVRDQALAEAGEVIEALPESDAGREYALNAMSKEGMTASSFAKAAGNDTIMRLQRTTPYYKRNKAQICSFFVRGECKRGAECPYRHEMPTSGPLSEQNIKDRYFGVNDPVANKMMDRLGESAKLETPEDTSITTLFIGSITPSMSEDEIVEPFLPFGEIQSVRKLEARHCAFLTFVERSSAEKAAEGLAGRLYIQGQRCRLLWGRPQAERTAPSTSMLPPQVQVQREAAAADGAQPAPGAGPPSAGAPANFFALPPPGAPMYASMDPTAMGTRGQNPNLALGKRPAGDGGPGEGPNKQQRMGPPHGGPGGYYGPPPGSFMPAPGYGPPPGYMGAPPPMFNGWRPGAAGGPPPMRPPMNAAPPTGPPAAAPAPAAAGSAGAAPAAPAAGLAAEPPAAQAAS